MSVYRPVVTMLQPNGEPVLVQKILSLEEQLAELLANDVIGTMTTEVAEEADEAAAELQQEQVNEMLAEVDDIEEQLENNGLTSDQMSQLNERRDELLEQMMDVLSLSEN
jgi:uncharacterized coiled-coil DUF342 family protein